MKLKNKLLKLNKQHEKHERDIYNSIFKTACNKNNLAERLRPNT